MVFATSRRRQDDQRAYALGAGEYRVKPESLSELCDAVRAILKR